MLPASIQYRFTATPWQHAGPGGWYFVSLPQDLSAEIRKELKSEEEGWGRLKVLARIGISEWKTAVWFDTKRNTYLLPLKAIIRQKENLNTGKDVTVTLYI